MYSMELLLILCFVGFAFVQGKYSMNEVRKLKLDSWNAARSAGVLGTLAMERPSVLGSPQVSCCESTTVCYECGLFRVVTEVVSRLMGNNFLVRM